MIDKKSEFTVLKHGLPSLDYIYMNCLSCLKAIKTSS